MNERTKMNGKPVYEVPAKSVINWNSGFKEKLLCDGPTFSLGSACAYSCSFCYVPPMMRKSPHFAGIKEKFEDVVIRRTGALETMERQLRSSKGRELSDKPLVIYASPLVDVAANMDLVRETVEACKSILSLTKWHIRLLSKSNLLPKVAQGLDGFCGSQEARERMIFGVSTGTLDDGICKMFEQGTPLVSKRIESLQWLQDHGWRTFGMICPSLPLPGNNYRKFAEKAANAIRVERCEHVWAEVINVRGESFTRTIDALRKGGYCQIADSLTQVSSNKEDWEHYARSTFLAHSVVIRNPNKLRFLQYVTNETRKWWQVHTIGGAVLL